MKISFLFLLSLTMISCSTNQLQEADFYNVISTSVPIEGGEIVFSDNPPYETGQNITITAVAAPNYKFSHWEGALTGLEVSKQLVLSNNIEVVAFFIPLERFAQENIVLYNEQGIDQSGYVFMMENGQKNAYLVNHEGEKLKEWAFEERFGNDIEITPSGDLLACFKSSDPIITFGGFGGVVSLMDYTGKELWRYEVNTENEIAHHDATQLPNGHVMIMVWERITELQLETAGQFPGHDIFLEKLIEVNPQTNEIVWQWRSWDHMVQNTAADNDLYGQLSDFPNKIDLNHSDLENGDWMHANGIFYDAATDLVYMSVNFYSEVWVIDHSTSSEEAKTSQGGNYNRGGDLVYRFGNPSLFENTIAPQFLFNNHHPSIVPNNYPGNGNFLIYNNGSNLEQSIAYELVLPAFSTNSMQNYIAPVKQWSFTNIDMYFDKISGLQRLPNGNTLICEGDYGYWEVSVQGEVVWKYDGLGKSFWRPYYYLKSDSRLLKLNLN